MLLDRVIADLGGSLSPSIYLNIYCRGHRRYIFTCETDKCLGLANAFLLSCPSILAAIRTIKGISGRILSQGSRYFYLPPTILALYFTTHHFLLLHLFLLYIYLYINMVCVTKCDSQYIMVKD